MLRCVVACAGARHCNSALTRLPHDGPASSLLVCVSRVRGGRSFCIGSARPRFSACSQPRNAHSRGTFGVCAPRVNQQHSATMALRVTSTVAARLGAAGCSRGIRTSTRGTALGRVHSGAAPLQAVASLPWRSGTVVGTTAGAMVCASVPRSTRGIFMCNVNLVRELRARRMA